ncbi:uncharacterized protein LOC120346976 [Styela clava]
MVCKTVEDIFDDTNHGGLSHSDHIGSPGPKGERGLPGEKGDSGIVNSDKTKAIIQEIDNAGMDKMVDIVEERILEKLRNKTENDATTEDTTTVIATTQGLSTEECSVVYNSKCFRAIVYGTRNYNVTLSVAESICENKLANMYDITHYKLLQEYLRPMIPDGWLGIYVRTGMTYKLGQLYSTTGQAISLPTEVWNPFFYLFRCIVHNCCCSCRAKPRRQRSRDF